MLKSLEQIIFITSEVWRKFELVLNAETLNDSV